MKHACAVLLLPFLLLCCGCEKLNDAQKSGLALAALTAKERAAAFDVIRPQIKAEKPEYAVPIQRYADVHGKQLNAQAIALADLVSAAKAGSLLSDSARKALAEEARTAASRARNWQLTIGDFNRQDPAVAQFVTTHAAALTAQAEALAQLSTLFPPKPEKSKKEEVKP